MRKIDLELPVAKKALNKILATKDSLIQDKIKWTELLAKINHHLIAIENGDDYEGEFLHSTHIQYYTSILTEYYKINAVGDDRKHKYMTIPRIGLDIDEVLADWVTAWTEHYKLQLPTSWYFDREIMEKFDAMREEGTLDSFYMSLRPKIKGSDLPFEPVCYITSRPVSTEVTQKWLDLHGFPARPVYTVGVGESKIAVAKKAGVEVFVDDRYENFREFNENNICCYLFDANHNKRYNVGFKRIKNLSDLPCIHPH